MEVIIRQLADTDMEIALGLVRRVFLEFEAPSYPEEGIQEFMRSVSDPDYLGKHAFFGAFSDGTLAGVIAARNGLSHIALLFVDARFHRQGIGRQLVDFLAPLSEKGFLTVNSAPFPHGFYQKQGFSDTDSLKNVNGISFWPMRKDVS